MSWSGRGVGAAACLWLPVGLGGVGKLPARYHVPDVPWLPVSCRYGDLLAHMQFKAQLRGQPPPFTADELAVLVDVVAGTTQKVSGGVWVVVVVVCVWECVCGSVCVRGAGVRGGKRGAMRLGACMCVVCEKRGWVWGGWAEAGCLPCTLRALACA